MNQLKSIIILVIFILNVGEIKPQNQSSNINPIISYSGIPVIGSYYFPYTLRDPAIMDSMKAMGVDFLENNIDDVSQLNYIYDKGLGVIAVNSFSNNWIQYYTDGKYTEWEAEGTIPSKGLATLEHKPLVMIQGQSGDTSFIKIASSATRYIDTLIWGPYYHQEVKYYTAISGDPEYISYQAEYVLKLEKNPEYPNDDDNPNSPICILQVTQSKLDEPNENWNLGCTHVIKSKTLKLGDFSELNKFLIFNMDYDLTSNECQLNPPSGITHLVTFGDNTSISNNFGLKILDDHINWFKFYVCKMLILKNGSIVWENF